MLVTYAASILAVALGAAAGKDLSVVTKLDHGTFTGITSGNVSSFLGIPFARPP